MKCGGTAVEVALRRMARRRRDIVFDPADYAGWHDSINERAARNPGFRLEDRTIVAGIRRLPHWLLSRVYYEAGRPPHLCATRSMLTLGEFYENDGSANSADKMLARYLSPTPHRWIRQEHLVEDFAAIFSRQTSSGRARPPREVRTVINATPIPYLKSLDFYFTPAELENLYACNPLWAALESRIYGDQLRLRGREDVSAVCGRTLVDHLTAAQNPD